MPKLEQTQRGTLVRAAVLSHYEEVSKHLGLNPWPLIRKVGLNRRVLSSPTELIPVTAAIDLLEDSAQTSGCNTLGLLMAEARLLSDFGPISLLLTHQPTLRAALGTIIQYRHLLNESLAMHIEEDGKIAIIREEILNNSKQGARQATELAVGVLLLIFRAVLGEKWRPQSVHFTHPAPQDLKTYNRLFACPLQFDSEFNGLVCLSSELDKKNMHADVIMAKYAQTFLDALPHPNQKSILLDVRKSIYLLLPMGRASIEQIAQGLGMNVRTLQRRLDVDSISFSGLINEVRRELAQRYVANANYSIGRISEQLGYANLSAFTRWFVSQFRTSPSQMRTRTLMTKRIPQ